MLFYQQHRPRHKKWKFTLEYRFKKKRTNVWCRWLVCRSTTARRPLSCGRPWLGCRPRERREAEPGTFSDKRTSIGARLVGSEKFYIFRKMIWDIFFSPYFLFDMLLVMSELIIIRFFDSTYWVIQNSSDIRIINLFF